MKKFLITSFAAIALFAFAAMFQLVPDANASIVVGNDYQSVEVTSSTASTSPVIVKAGTGSLGSVIIASSTSGATFRIYDNAVATSSATSTRIVSFPVSAAGGTYTFDREIIRGIVLEVPVGFNGSYVVTYR
jgi:hypothetical protein